MTSSPHGPYALGWTHATMAGIKGSEAARWSEALKAGPSTDRGLQFAPVNVGIASNRGSATPR
jgi:hypothetical protein